MKNLTREEQETTINWGKAEDIASVYSSDPVVMRKLDKLTKAYPDIYKIEQNKTAFNERTYHVPVKYIRFGKPKSKAQLEALAKARVLAQKSPVVQG